MKKVESLNVESNMSEIKEIASKLIDLKVRKATRRSFKSHEVKKNKKRLARLLTNID